MDHLKDAGIDACWLSPIFASPQVDTGYDVSDFYTIEPDYGTMEDFDNMIKKSNDLGIRLMLDFIPNHTSNLHEWFIRSENNENGFSDYYVWRDGTLEGGLQTYPNNWVSVFGGSAWTWSEKRQQSVSFLKLFVDSFLKRHCLKVLSSSILCGTTRP